MRLPSFYYRIVKDKKIRIGAGVLLVLIGLGFAWASQSSGNLLSVQGRAQFLRDNPAVTKILPVYWQLRKLSDITYVGYAFRRDETPSYRLEIAADDLQKLNASLPKGFMGVVYTNKIFVPAKFYHGQNSYDVRVRYRGDNAVHWNAPKKSYLVRFKETEPVDGMTEINFIIPDDRYFALEHFNNYRAGKLGLHHPQSGFANLTVNGQKGLYFTIESWSKAMLAKWGVPEDSFFYGEKDLEATGGELWADVSNWQLIVGKDSPERFAPLMQLLALLNEASDAEFNARIFTLLDKENFYAWRIHQELANSSHQAIGNVRLYFDRSKSRFFFVPWDVEIENPAEHQNIEYYGPLGERIFSNPEFLREKNEQLRVYVADEKNLEDDLAFYDRTYESFKISLYRDRLKIYSNRFADEVFRTRRQFITDIFNRLRVDAGLPPVVE